MSDVLDRDQGEFFRTRLVVDEGVVEVSEAVQRILALTDLLDTLTTDR